MSINIEDIKKGYIHQFEDVDENPVFPVTVTDAVVDPNTGKTIKATLDDELEHIEQEFQNNEGSPSDLPDPEGSRWARFNNYERLRGDGLKYKEDLFIDSNNEVKLADRDNTDGMGYVILRKDKSFAEQVTKENTIYEIRYDFNLNEEEVVIPENSILKFTGGKFYNGYIKGNNTSIEASNYEIFNRGTSLFTNYRSDLNSPLTESYVEKVIDKGIVLSGTWNNLIVKDNWCGLLNEDNRECSIALKNHILLHGKNEINVPFGVYNVYAPIKIYSSANFNNSVIQCPNFDTIQDDTISIPDGKYRCDLQTIYGLITTKINNGYFRNCIIDQREKKSGRNEYLKYRNHFGSKAAVSLGGNDLNVINVHITDSVEQNITIQADCSNITFTDCSFGESGEHVFYTHIYKGNTIFNNCTFSNWSNNQLINLDRQGANYAFKFVGDANKSIVYEPTTKVICNNCTFINHPTEECKPGFIDSRLNEFIFNGCNFIGTMGAITTQWTAIDIGTLENEHEPEFKITFENCLGDTPYINDSINSPDCFCIVRHCRFNNVGLLPSIVYAEQLTIENTEGYAYQCVTSKFNNRHNIRIFKNCKFKNIECIINYKIIISLINREVLSSINLPKLKFIDCEFYSVYNSETTMFDIRANKDNNVVSTPLDFYNCVINIEKGFLCKGTNNKLLFDGCFIEKVGTTAWPIVVQRTTANNDIIVKNTITNHLISTVDKTISCLASNVYDFNKNPVYKFNQRFNAKSGIEISTNFYINGYHYPSDYDFTKHIKICSINTVHNFTYSIRVSATSDYAYRVFVTITRELNPNENMMYEIELNLEKYN